MKKIPRKPKRACQRYRYRNRQALHRELDKLTKRPLIGPRHAKIIIALALASAGILLYQIPQKATEIEQDLKQQAMAMLQQHQLQNIHIDMNGLTATLTGHVASDAHRQQAARLIAGMSGVRKVVNEIRLDADMEKAASATTSPQNDVPSPKAADDQNDEGVFPASLASHIRAQTARLASAISTPAVETGKNAQLSISQEQSDSPSLQRQAQAHENTPPADSTGQQTVTELDTASPNSPSAQPDGQQEQAALQAALKCEEQFSSLLKKEQILFRHNSAHIRQKSEPLLEKLLDLAAHQCPQAYLIIVGHTDNRGSARYNRELSQRRAEAVRQWLIRKGIPAHRLQAVGRGEEAPIASNRTKAGRAKNRRIEIRVLLKLK